MDTLSSLIAIRGLLNPVMVKSNGGILLMIEGQTSNGWFYGRSLTHSPSEAIFYEYSDQYMIVPGDLAIWEII